MRRRPHSLLLAVLLAMPVACVPDHNRSGEALAEAPDAVLTNAQRELREQILCRAMAYEQLARDIGGRRPLVMAGAEDLGRPAPPRRAL